MEVPATGNVRLEFILERAVDRSVTGFRCSGRDANGTEVYGPFRRDRGREFLFEDVPISVVVFRIEYLLDDIPVGESNVGLVIVPGQTTVISDPDYVDLPLSLVVEPSSLTIPAGVSTQFSLFTNVGGQRRDFSSAATWSSSDPSVATISDSGLLNALSRGRTVISVLILGRVVEIQAEVTDAAITGLSISPDVATIAKGLKGKFSARATFSDGTDFDVSSQGDWTSSATTVASIDQSGTASGLLPGRTTVEFSFGGFRQQAQLEVVPALATRLSVQPIRVTLAKGISRQFSAFLEFTDGTRQDVTTQATWDSTLATVATISQAGLANTLEVGTTQVRAVIGVQMGEATLEVTPAVVTNLQLSPRNATLMVATNRQYSVVAEFTDGTITDVTAQAEWNSTAPSTASVSPGGLAMALSPGDTMIEARFGGTIVRTELEVVPPVPVSLAISPSRDIVAAPNTMHSYRATAVLSNGDIQDVTENVVWSSTSPAVASVSNDPGSQGRVTVLGSHGSQTTIRASLVAQGLNAESELFVRLFLFAHGSGRIDTFTIDTVTGDLTAVNTRGTLATGALQIAMRSDGVLYVPNRGNGGISAYHVQPDGSLVELSGSPFPVGRDILWCALRPGAGDTLYAAIIDGQVLGFRLDEMGALTPLSGSPYPGDVHGPFYMDPLGRFAYLQFLDGLGQYRIGSDGELDFLGSFGSGVDHTLAIHPNGLFGARVRLTNSFIAVDLDQVTGQLSQIRNITTTHGDSQAAVFSADGNQLFVSTINSSRLHVYSVDAVNKDFNEVDVLAYASQVNPIELHLIPGTELLVSTNFAGSSMTIFRRNPTTGTTTLLRTTSIGFGPLSAELTR